MANGLLVTGPIQAPLWYTIIRGAIIVLSLGVLIAAAYHLSLYGGYSSGDSGPAGFLIFDAIFTWIIIGAMLAFETFVPKLFFRVAFVGALALDAIFWLAAWAWAASWASTFFGYYDGDKFGSSLAAAAALGALTWVLIVVTLIFLVMFSLRDGGSSTEAGNAELGTMQTQTHEQKMYDQTQPTPQHGVYDHQQGPPQNMAPQQQYEQQPHQHQQSEQQQQYPPQDVPPTQQHYGQQPPPQ